MGCYFGGKVERVKINMKGWRDERVFVYDINLKRIYKKFFFFKKRKNRMIVKDGNFKIKYLVIKMNFLI